MATTYSIGDLAREFDLTTRAIRFYEDMGLLQPGRSGPGGRNRVYSGRDRTRPKLTLPAQRMSTRLPKDHAIVHKNDRPRDTGAPQETLTAGMGQHTNQVEDTSTALRTDACEATTVASLRLKSSFAALRAAKRSTDRPPRCANAANADINAVNSPSASCGTDSVDAAPRTWARMRGYSRGSMGKRCSA